MSTPRSAAAAAAIHYRVECADRNAHLFAVTLTIDRPAPHQRVSLPVWIPGSYLVREFAKNLQGLNAKQGRRNIGIAQLDKSTWEVDCTTGQPLVLRYEVCAYDNSVRTAWLDVDRGFFNGTSLCLRVDAQTDSAHAIEVVAPKLLPGHARWSCVTALVGEKVDKQGFGAYRAAGTPRP